MYLFDHKNFIDLIFKVILLKIIERLADHYQLQIIIFFQLLF